jgi:hypothetical protein
MASKEADNKLAMSAVDTQKIRSSCSTATIYDVDERTLRRRYAGVVARLDCHPNSKKLARTEEEVIVQRILDPDQRGFPLTYAAVRDMANKLLATQPGNREWVTVIQAINATGWTIPPFLVFAGQYYLSAWCEEVDPETRSLSNQWSWIGFTRSTGG